MSRVAVIWVLVGLSVFFSVSRLWFPSHHLSRWGTWEAFVHIFVGVLIGFVAENCRTKDWTFAWFCAIALFVPTAVETVCFVFFEKGIWQ